MTLVPLIQAMFQSHLLTIHSLASDDTDLPRTPAQPALLALRSFYTEPRSTQTHYCCLLGHMNPQLPGVLRVNVPESRAALLPLLSDVLICRCVECIFGPCVDRVSLLSPFVMQAAHQGVAADNLAAHVLVKFGVHFHGALRWPNSSLQRDRAKSRPAP